MRNSAWFGRASEMNGDLLVLESLSDDGMLLDGAIFS